MLARAHIEALRPQLRALAADAVAFANAFQVARSSVGSSGSMDRRAFRDEDDLLLVNGKDLSLSPEHRRTVGIVSARLRALKDLLTRYSLR